MSWLSDPIFAIRENAMQVIKKLTLLFGIEWMMKYALPKLISYETEDNYLYRLTPLLAFKILDEVLNEGVYEESMFPLLKKLASDPITNVKMNVAQILGSWGERIKGESIGERSSDILKTLKSDSEFDVSYFAEMALKKY